MRLYVHFEPRADAAAWTKRLTLPPVEAASVSPTVRLVVQRFLVVSSAKFRPQREPQLETLDVFVEFQQNEASRRLLLSLDVPLTSLGACSLYNEGDTCEFELFLVPREPQRKREDPDPSAAVEPLEKSTTQTRSRVEESQDSQVRAALELAAKYADLKKLRAARELYREVLKKKSRNTEALLALGNILVACGRHGEAVETYFKKAWEARGGLESGRKAEAKLLATNALRLTECYIKMMKFDDALRVLGELQTFLQGTHDSGGKTKALFPDAEEMEEQTGVLKATALYETRRRDNEEEAISLLVKLLPDLQAPTLNLDALLLYARVAHDRGKKSEALSMALRVLVGKPNDRAVKEALVSLLEDSGSLQRLQEAVSPTGPFAGGAYAFLATILKDVGALEKSIVCFQQAQICDPHSASYALNHAHALEASCRYAEAYGVLMSFFRKNRTLSIGSGERGATKLMAGTFADVAGAWSSIQERDSGCGGHSPGVGNEASGWRIKWMPDRGGHAIVTPPTSDPGGAKVAPFTVDEQQEKTKGLPPLSETELDLLACFFTVVKVLFVSGRLSALPPLIHALEPLRLGCELHRTSIRNEQAYYACIAQLLSIDGPPAVYPPPSRCEADTKSIYVCGDSHTLATAWREINVHGQRTLLRPALVTGLKHWHLRKETSFYPKINFWRVVDKIPSKSRVIFLFGEIDCREGIVDAVEKCKYEVRRTWSLRIKALAVT
jgi:tetratricopeptide (TPR) repeat protein